MYKKTPKVLEHNRGLLKREIESFS